VEEKGVDKEGAEIIVNSIVKGEPKRPSFLEVLSMLSPGNGLRRAVDDILQGKTGALIVIDCPEMKDVLEGGFAVNCPFTPQKLAELAKMDGAILVSSDLKKILHANALLVPTRGILSEETGTRHKAAERTSKQADTPTICVSERRHKISLFYQGKKYVLQDSESLLRRATETLNILEKQREIYDDLLTNLNVLEITGLVSVGDLCSVLQRIEIISKILKNLKRNLIELGSEGAIIQMRVREMFGGLEDVKNLILVDYSKRPIGVNKILSNMDFDGLLDTQKLARIMFESQQDERVSPKGYRILNKLDLTSDDIKALIANFEDLTTILNVKDDDLRKVIREKTPGFRMDIDNLKEQIMVGKKI